jgi:hypothetical protein
VGAHIGARPRSEVEVEGEGEGEEICIGAGRDSGL